jgi:TolA-binding protein
MKKKLPFIFLLLAATLIYSGEIDDFRFALGLYSDQNYSLAKTELRSFIKQYPDSEMLDNVRFLLANINLNEKNYSESLPLFEQLFNSETDPVIRPEVYLGLAQCYFFTNRPDRAYEIFTRYLREFKQHKNAWKAFYFLGRIEFQRGNFPVSLNNLNNAERLSADWLIRVAKTETLLALERAEEVKLIIDNYIAAETKEENLYRMIVLYLNYLLKSHNFQPILSYAYHYIPSSSQYYDDYLLILSEAKYETGNYEKALSTLQLIENERERAEYLKALCYLELGHLDRAEPLFSKLSKDALNIEIKSNSYFYLAGLKGRNDIDAANKMLEQFIRENPEHSFTGAAFYQLALNHFLTDRFSDALAGFANALNKGISNEFTEKARFLTAESYFQLQQRQEAMKWYKEYLTDYPQGSFIDEALFKTGLYHYERADYPNALVQFERLITEFPGSSRLSMAYFYQGEIFTENQQYDIAISKYQAALPAFEDQGLLRMRLAQINFLQGDYDQALLELSNVPDTPEFLFEKHIITGNVHFAKRSYLQALRNFDEAAKRSTNDRQWEDSILRQARTLYQLKEYREATKLYNSLYERTPDKQYLLMAATAAFTNEDYRTAISFYERYVEDYPEERNLNQIRLHIADSYYNLKDYVMAALKYRELIIPDMTHSILVNSLNGLEWSALQSDDVDFIQLLNESITPESPNDFLVMLYGRKISYYYSQEEWNEVINNVRFIQQLSPSEPQLFEYRRMMAISHTRLNQYYDAERIFSSLHSEKSDPAVLYAWAKLELAREDRAAALAKMQQAVQLTNDSQIWLEFLTLSVTLNDQNFLRNYERYLQFARNVEKEQAMLLLVRWNLRKENYDSALRTIETLLQSSYEPIKAKAQYYKGVHLYQTGNPSAAIPELLRVRYLYPRIEDVRLEAELLAIQAYIETNDKENARKLYDAIRNSLSPAQREEINALLEG